MVQKDLLEPDYWRSGVERSKIRRYPWKKVLGEPLRQLVYRYKRAGKTQSEIVALVESHIISEEGEIEDWVNENLRIGVSAGFSENKSIKYVERI